MINMYYFTYDCKIKNGTCSYYLTDDSIISEYYKMNLGNEDQQDHSNSYGMSGKQYQTAIKERVDHEASKDFLITPTPHKKHIYRPSNIKLITQKQCALQSFSHSGESPDDIKTSKNGSLVAITYSIRNQNNRYWFELSDQTMKSSHLNVYFSKMANFPTLISFIKNKPEDESVEELQFEPTKQGGQPYFKFWIKHTFEKKPEEVDEVGWQVEKVERVKDHNEISYHWCSIMCEQLQCQI